MGNLLRLLARDESCCALPKQDIFVDFENAAPSIDEAQIYQEAEDLLLESEEVLRDLMGYRGACKEIREAITNPTVDNEAVAWNAVAPSVRKLKTFYDFSLKLEALVPRILHELCIRPRPGLLIAGTVAEQLDEHQALVKQFAKVLEFVLKFDEYKMMNPALQNDFSYYRRTTQRNRSSISHQAEVSSQCTHRNVEGMDDSVSVIARPWSQNEAERQLSLSTANCMSLFFANATPMLQSLSSATSKYVADEQAHDATTEMLGVMAKVCQKMLELPELKSRIQYEETELFILRVMVAIVILYDHVQPTGAFAKGSVVDVKGCVRILREQDRSRSEGLMNALRYTTKHLNDDTTPKSIKSLLFEEQA